MFLDHTHVVINTPGRTPLNELSAGRRRTSMLSAGLEPAIPPIKQLHTYALDRTATGVASTFLTYRIIILVNRSIAVVWESRPYNASRYCIHRLFFHRYPQHDTLVALRDATVLIRTIKETVCTLEICDLQ
jgi:hypothetical protein